MKKVITYNGKEYVVNYSLVPEEYDSIKEILGISLHIDPKSIIINNITSYESGDLAFPPVKSEKCIISSIPGFVSKITVQEGDHIVKGQTVAIVEAMKMENEIIATYSGVVSRILVPEKVTVERNEPIIELE